MSESDFQSDRPQPPPRGEGPANPDVRNRPPAPRSRPAPPAHRQRRDVYEHPDNSDLGGLIPYRNPLGLTAYYLGVFSLIPCIALLLGPAALILGIMGVRAYRADTRRGGVGHAISGIVMGSITTLLNLIPVLFFFGVLAWKGWR